jgi:putative ABC transport system ATP-binding protein
MTALQNVELPMILRGIPPEDRRARANALLTQVGLEERIAHKPTELSGGQQQRVAIARALANDPAIVLADEPTGNLDSRTGTEIMDLLSELNRTEHRTIVIVSHDPLVTNYATTAIHLQDGQLCQQATSRATYTMPNHCRSPKEVQ